MKKRGYRFPRQNLPNGEGCDTRMPLSPHRQSEYTHMWKKNNDGQSLPRVGKVASEASRIGDWRDERERERSSQVCRLRKHPSAAGAVPLPRWGRQRGGDFAAQKRKPTPPRCARQPLPREGARVDTHSFLWKEVPRRGGGWMEGSGISVSQPSPHGEGGERSEPDRVLAG